MTVRPGIPEPGLMEIRAGNAQEKRNFQGSGWSAEMMVWIQRRESEPQMDADEHGWRKRKMGFLLRCSGFSTLSPRAPSFCNESDHSPEIKDYQTANPANRANPWRSGDDFTR